MMRGPWAHKIAYNCKESGDVCQYTVIPSSHRLGLRQCDGSKDSVSKVALARACMAPAMGVTFGDRVNPLAVQTW